MLESEAKIIKLIAGGTQQVGQHPRREMDGQCFKLGPFFRLKKGPNLKWYLSSSLHSCCKTCWIPSIVWYLQQILLLVPSPPQGYRQSKFKFSTILLFFNYYNFTAIDLENAVKNLQSNYVFTDEQLILSCILVVCNSCLCNIQFQNEVEISKILSL